ncbi:MAG: PDZ domain-containing protein [Planctomycetes bacterium]|nr:PDZ domain-containing protein [Planctomycetota bacterium]
MKRNVARGCLAVLVLLSPVARADEGDGDRVAALVAALGSEEFDAREAAARELETLAAEAVPHLKAALSHEDPEVRWRAERILARIEARAQGRDPDAAEPGGAPPRPSGLQQRFFRLPAGAPGAPGQAPRVQIQIVPGGQAPAQAQPADPASRLKSQIERTERRRQRYEERAKENTDDPEKAEKYADRAKEMEEEKKALAEELEKIEEGAAEPPRREDYLGIVAGDMAPALRAQLDIPEGGLLVEEIVPDSPAAKSGVLRYDIVLSAAGRPVSDLGELRRAGESLQAGDALRLSLVRKGERIELLIR